MCGSCPEDLLGHTMYLVKSFYSVIQRLLMAGHRQWRRQQSEAEPARIIAHECGIGDGSSAEAVFTFYDSAAGAGLALSASHLCCHFEN